MPRRRRKQQQSPRWAAPRTLRRPRTTTRTPPPSTRCTSRRPTAATSPSSSTRTTTSSPSRPATAQAGPARITAGVTRSHRVEVGAQASTCTSSSTCTSTSIGTGTQWQRVAFDAVARGILLGAVADDVTGATDLCSVLAREGMRAVQTIGVAREVELPETEALVVALKSRTAPVEEAVAQSLDALSWLRELGAGR